MKFTDAGVRALKAEAERYIAWADGAPGFGLRVSPKGRKSWIYMYRFDGRSRMMTLGVFPAVGLADARIAYGNAVKALEGGTDPGADVVAENKADREAMTVADLIDLYVAKWAKPRKRSWAEDERMLLHDVKPTLGNRKAKSIARKDMLDLLDKIVDRGAPIQANRVLAVTRRMFNFAIERDIVESSPCYRVRAPSKEQAKERVLSTTEIQVFWPGVDDADMLPVMRLALRFLLVTAQRKSEVTTMKWHDLDLKEKVWTIPGELTKNGEPHRVPLSRLALRIIGEARVLYERRPEKENEEAPPPYVFLSPRTRAALTPEALGKAILRNEKAFALPHFTPHDLRRTAATHITGMGTSRLVVKKILNHVDRDGATPVYDRYAYDAEKRKALDAWCRRLEDIIRQGVKSAAAKARASARGR